MPIFRRMPPLFYRLLSGTSSGLLATSILIAPPSWWMQKQQLKKGEEEIRQLRKAISNTKAKARTDRDR
ncbi:hypothetical protein EG329_013866 [Mollisiaceae sp. DMI_Dod_QoI]|nr:hypothetical protein EG329_013866 [Helotiales sp. DMI_Dod_QoI]